MLSGGRRQHSPPTSPSEERDGNPLTEHPDLQTQGSGRGRPTKPFPPWQTLARPSSRPRANANTQMQCARVPRRPWKSGVACSPAPPRGSTRYSDVVGMREGLGPSS